MDRQAVIAELQRVAALLNSRTLSRSTFAKHGDISTTVVEATFGTWNEAIEAAGLVQLPQGGLPKADHRRRERLGEPKAGNSRQQISDDALLDDLLRLAKTLGRRPSGNQISAKGSYSPDIYQKRWGSVHRAYEVALARVERADG